MACFPSAASVVAYVAHMLETAAVAINPVFSYELVMKFVLSSRREIKFCIFVGYHVLPHLFKTDNDPCPTSP